MRKRKVKRRSRRRVAKAYTFHPLHVLLGVIGLVVVGLFIFFSARHSRAADITAAGTYVDWNWPGSGYTTREWTATPVVDSSPAAYFYAHQQGFDNGDGFYVGMQTANGGRSKLFLFSIWNALQASSNGTNAGTCSTFGGEGVGYHCSINYDWVAGHTYRYKVAKVSPGWWGAWVIDTATNTELLIGKIQVPLSWGGLSNWSVEWTEYFVSTISQCTDLPYSAVVWGVPISDGTVYPSSANPHISQTDCTFNSKITKQSDGSYLQEEGLTKKLSILPTQALTPTLTPTPSLPITSTPIPSRIPPTDTPTPFFVCLGSCPTPSPAIQPTTSARMPRPTGNTVHPTGVVSPVVGPSGTQLTHGLKRKLVSGRKLPNPFQFLLNLFHLIFHDQR